MPAAAAIDAVVQGALAHTFALRKFLSFLKPHGSFLPALPAPARAALLTAINAAVTDAPHD